MITTFKFDALHLMQFTNGTYNKYYKTDNLYTVNWTVLQFVNA